MKKGIFTLALMLVTFSIHAEVIDGICYKLDKKSKKAEVIRGAHTCSGAVSIPGNFIYDDIMYNVTSIGESAFWANKNITSINIPSNVETIGKSAFESCTNLNTIQLSFVKTIGESAFESSGLTSIDIPIFVRTVGNDAFRFCRKMTSAKIGNGVSKLGNNAFQYCDSLKEVTLDNNSIISQNRTAQQSLSSIFGKQVKKYILGNTIKSIGNFAFSNCDSLKTFDFSWSAVESIGGNAFQNCKKLEKVIIPNIFRWCNIKFTGWESNPLYYAHHLYSSENSEITNLTIHQSVTTIGKYAFQSCFGLTSVTIPNSVTSIDVNAFHNCYNLTSITIPESVTNIGSNAFEGCHLDEVTITNPTLISQNRTVSTSFADIFGNDVKKYILPNNLTKIGNNAFFYCIGMTSIEIPESVTSIGNGAFVDCRSLTSISIPFGVTSISNNVFQRCTSLNSVTIPSSVTSIGDYAFGGDTCLTSISIPDNVTSIGKSIAPETTKLFVNRGTITLLSFWNSGQTPYETGTNEKLAIPVMEQTKRTQTKLSFKVSPYYTEYDCKYNDINTQKTETMKCDSLAFRNLQPDKRYNMEITLSKGNSIFKLNQTTSTESLYPSIKKVKTTASSISVACSYTKGDAVVTNESIRVNGKSIEGTEATFTGLNPESYCEVEYIISGIHENGQKWYHVGRNSWHISALRLQTLQPKVITEGNVIVAAQSNVDDEETNVGFEWRRTDWSDEFPSNTGAAYLYEGTLEGFIRNLNVNHLFKFRPYYISDSGTYYYGDWMGLDPTNTSYFEPTVHTYASITVEGNTALVKGYALRGTDNVKVQGFKYWKANSNSNIHHAPVIPSDAKTVEATGQVMTASLTDLDYESTYCYTAFVTTTEGETFYGEQQMFTTGENTTGINEAELSTETPATAIVVARYNMRGMRIESPERGINILKMSDGTTRKVLVK